jgi:hypothetical protein
MTSASQWALASLSTMCSALARATKTTTPAPRAEASGGVLDLTLSEPLYMRTVAASFLTDLCT